MPTVNQFANEIEVGLASTREPNFDLLVAHFHEQLEHLELALRAHRVDKCLVAVTEVDRAPAWGLGDSLGWPGSVWQLDHDLLVERLVLMHRHLGRFLGVVHLLAPVYEVWFSRR